MNAHEDEGALRGGGWFVTAAGVLGDLGHQFYAEERQRDVWNEACAVGLQLILWLSLAAATAMAWLGGALAFPYAATVMVVVGAAAWVTLLYARRLGVRIDDTAGMVRLRLVPYGAMLVAFLVGVLRAAPTDGFSGGFSGGFAGGFAWGMVAGGVAAVLWMLISGIRARRRKRLGER